MYTNTLTATKKDKRIQHCIARDGGDQCYYCWKMGPNASFDPSFVPGHKHLKRELDHLNKNEGDNRPENFVLAHAICNIKHRDNHPEINVLAIEKLRENVKNSDRTTLSEGVMEGETKKLADKETHELKETDINMIVNKLVKAYLEEKLPEKEDKAVFYSQALASLHFLTIQQTGGRGSEQAVRRSIMAYTSEYAPWEDYKDGTGKRMIRRRKTN